MSTSTHLALPFLTLGQAQKHVTVNEALLRLDALVQLAVVSATVAAQPASPADGDLYILPAGKTGASWGGMTNGALAYYRDGVWEQLTPREGWCAFVKDVDQFCIYSGSAWVRRPGLAEANTFTAKQSVQGAALTIDSNASGEELLSRTMIGLELIAREMGTTAKFTPPIKFMSADAQFSTENPKLLAAIAGRALQPYNDNNDGGMVIDFFTTPNDPGASSLPLARMTLGTGLVLGAPTGGDKGAGTLNATAVYDDNTLLTCFVLEYARTGALNLDFWDSTAPRGHHAATHRFWGQRELLDVDAYTAYWKEFGHLPGLPAREEWAEHARDKKSVGEMISRLWQTVEMQAVHIAQLRDEIKKLRA